MREIKVNCKYRHFKGGVYTVFAITKPIKQHINLTYHKRVTHTETEEKFNILVDDNGKFYHNEQIDTDSLVIYSKDGENFWARPYSMFVSTVDRTKYPEVTQKYRLEEIPE